MYCWHLHNEMCKAISVKNHTEVCRLIGNGFSSYEAFSAFESCDIPQSCMPKNVFSGIPEHLAQERDEL